MLIKSDMSISIDFIIVRLIAWVPFIVRSIVEKYTSN